MTHKYSSYRDYQWRWLFLVLMLIYNMKHCLVTGWAELVLSIKEGRTKPVQYPLIWELSSAHVYKLMMMWDMMKVSDVGLTVFTFLHLSDSHWSQATSLSLGFEPVALALRALSLSRGCPSIRTIQVMLIIRIYFITAVYRCKGRSHQRTIAIAVCVCLFWEQCVCVCVTSLRAVVHLQTVSSRGPQRAVEWS